MQSNKHARISSFSSRPCDSPSLKVSKQPVLCEVCTDSVNTARAKRIMCSTQRALHMAQSVFDQKYMLFPHGWQYVASRHVAEPACCRDIPSGCAMARSTAHWYTVYADFHVHTSDVTDLTEKQSVSAHIAIGKHVVPCSPVAMAPASKLNCREDQDFQRNERRPA